MILPIYYSPDPEPGPSDVTPEPEPDPTPEPTPSPEPGDVYAKGFAAGRQEGRKQSQVVTIEMLKRYGIDIVKDQKGNPDVEKSIEKYRNSQLGASEVIDQIKRQTERQIETLTTENNTLRQTMKQRELDNRLSSMISLHEPHNPRLALIALKEAYLIEETEDGIISATKLDGTPVYDKNTGRPMGVEGVVDLFFEENKYLLKPQVRPGIGERDRKGMPLAITDEELQRAYMSESDPKKAHEIKQEMLKRAGYRV